MQPLYTRDSEEKDGSILRMQWGYCHEQNAVRLGYAANILAAALGLIMVLIGKPEGALVVASVGLSFGLAYFGEQMPCGKVRNAFAGLCAGATLAAYLLALVTV